MTSTFIDNFNFIIKGQGIVGELSVKIEWIYEQEWDSFFEPPVLVWQNYEITLASLDALEDRLGMRIQRVILHPENRTGEIVL